MEDRAPQRTEMEGAGRGWRRTLPQEGTFLQVRNDARVLLVRRSRIPAPTGNGPNGILLRRRVVRRVVGKKSADGSIEPKRELGATSVPGTKPSNEWFVVQHERGPLPSAQAKESRQGRIEQVVRKVQQRK